MGFTPNEVYELVEEAVLAAAPDAYCSSVYEPTPKSFPAVFIRNSGSSNVTRHVNLNNDDDVARSSWEIQVFSAKEDGNATEANTIMDYADVRMRALGFIRDAREPIDNVADYSIYRIVARYHRVVGGGDSLPTLPVTEVSEENAET